MRDTGTTHDLRAAAIARWLAAAEADADARGLPELKPLLQGLAASTAALRAADWNDDADGFPTPASREADRS
ncbi:MAG: hypothetical protein JNL48_16450 [Acidobacteria bacterium]|nr:hypothetical protein [Acidobacteriota bacterium]